MCCSCPLLLFLLSCTVHLYIKHNQSLSLVGLFWFYFLPPVRTAKPPRLVFLLSSVSCEEHYSVSAAEAVWLGRRKFMGCDGQFEQSCRWILNPVCYFPNSTSLQSKMLLTLTTTRKLVRRRVKDSLIQRFRLKSNGLVFHKLLINIKQGSDSWRELFLGPCVGF